MRNFEQKFDFEENPFNLLPKLVKSAYPKQYILANELETLREEGKFDELKKNIANLQIFSHDDIYNGFDQENEDEDDNINLFTKSFLICKQTNPEGYLKELQKLKKMLFYCYYYIYYLSYYILNIGLKMFRTLIRLS